MFCKEGRIIEMLFIIGVIGFSVFKSLKERRFCIDFVEVGGV